MGIIDIRRTREYRSHMGFKKRQTKRHQKKVRKERQAKERWLAEHEGAVWEVVKPK